MNGSTTLELCPLAGRRADQTLQCNGSLRLVTTVEAGEGGGYEAVQASLAHSEGGSARLNRQGRT